MFRSAVRRSVMVAARRPLPQAQSRGLAGGHGHAEHKKYEGEFSGCRGGGEREGKGRED